MITLLVNFIKYWHPKVALRYLPIVEEIQEHGGNKGYKGDWGGEEINYSVLEVGSGAIGIAPYLNQKVVGADRDFSDKECPLLKQVVADAASLPFTDRSFDFVVTVDVIEHIAPEKRQQAVSEWVRVAKHELIIAFPEGKEAESQDRELYEQFKKKNCHDFAEKFFEEHLEFGLPEIKEVIGWIKGVMGIKGIGGEIRVKENLNLNLRKLLMRGWMTQNFFVDFFFRKIMLIFIPVLRLFNQKPTYRKIIFVRLI